MKRYLLLCLLALGTLIATAQTSSEHMKFMGIPMKGTAQAFAQKLQAKGMTIAHKYKNGTITLNGTFFNYSNCAIDVLSSSRTNTVYAVSVSFPEEDSWSGLESTYYYIRKSLIDKYGQPMQTIETFTDGTPSSDYAKLNALEDGKCQYVTRFSTDNGIISLKISSYKASYTTSSRVTLLYGDEKNYDRNKAEASEDL